MRGVLLAVAALVAGVGVGALKPWPYGPIAGAIKPPKVDVSYVHRVSLFGTLKTAPDTVMLGDSITQRNEWSEWMPGTANRGIDGDTVAGVHKRLAVSVPASTRRVFLMIGVNDLRRGAKAEDVAREYGALLRDLRGHKVYAQSTLYTRDPKVNAKVAVLNRRIAQECATGLCEYVDLTPALTPNNVLPTNFSTDGVHLNGEAYRIWDAAIRRLP